MKLSLFLVFLLTLVFSASASAATVTINSPAPGTVIANDGSGVLTVNYSVSYTNNPDSLDIVVCGPLGVDPEFPEDGIICLGEDNLYQQEVNLEPNKAAPATGEFTVPIPAGAPVGEYEVAITYFTDTDIDGAKEDCISSPNNVPGSTNEEEEMPCADGDAAAKFTVAPPAPPVDVCPNLDGAQPTVPVGLIQDGAGNCVTPPPADVCPNLDGEQTQVPVGMIIDNTGNCVAQDVCPNIDGVQSSVPVGMIQDALGNCIANATPPVDVCPNIDGAQATIPTGMIKDATGNCVAAPAVDMCPNITGDQAAIPTGMIKDATGNCVAAPTTDVCPNITGDQAAIPTGMIKDSAGNCVEPPVDVCPNIDGAQATIPTGMLKDASGNCVTPEIEEDTSGGGEESGNQCLAAYTNQCLYGNIGDYDCKGSGNGPNFVEGSVKLANPDNDPFELDGNDRDGVGCEDNKKALPVVDNPPTVTG